MNRCRCGVLTPRRLCYFCARTVALIQARRCVSCTGSVVESYEGRVESKCGDCLERNNRLSAATRRLTHLAANARARTAAA